MVCKVLTRKHQWFQYLEVQSNTIHGAREQLESVYGSRQVIDLHQVNSDNGRISSDMSDSVA